MPTVERPQSLGIVEPRSSPPEDPEDPAGSVRFRQAGRKVINAQKVLFHREQAEEPDADCCDDLMEFTGIGKDKQQDDIDRMWSKNEAIFDNPSVDIDFRDLMNVQFAEDSGFEDVPKLWMDGQSMHVRSFHAFLAVAFVVYNTDYVIESDFHAINMTGEVHEQFLVSRVLWNTAVQTFYPGHHLVSTTRNHQLIGVMELIGLFLLYLNGLNCLIMIYCPRLIPRFWLMDKEKLEPRASRGRWLSSTFMYTSLIPSIGSYSGMRLLHYVQTKSISTDMANIRARPMGTLSRYATWLWFIISRLFFLVVGFDMFLTKFRVAKDQGVFAMHQHDTFEYMKLFRSFLFMRQVLGVLKVDVLVRERLFLFVFGGSDSVMETKDKAVQRVWEALTTRRIYRKCHKEYGRGLGTLAYMVVMMTFGDEDFQRLTLDPKQAGKK